MKLQIGLVAPSPAWEQIFKQEGVPFAQIDLLTDTISDECSALVVNRELSTSERDAVEAYLQRGGAVLGYTRHLLNVAGTTGTREKLDYLVGDSEGVFPSVHLLDLGLYGMIPREANALRTQENRFGAFAGALGGGYAVLLPFDAAEVLGDVRTASKSFYSQRERLPAERVSLVGKGEVRQLLHRSFEYLHHTRSLPYACLWKFPHGRRNLFAFRIDTDGASRRDVDELYGLARRYGISISWFLDVGRHGTWLKHFASMVDQEIGTHCFEHKEFVSHDEHVRDMSRAVKEMEAVGLKPVGFTAPFGNWNVELGRAIDQMGFQYSSEFSYAYDTLPFFPIVQTQQFNTLQIPIHPICIGSLMKVGYSSAQMKEYYWRVIVEKLAREEPLFFYHHPSHRHWDVVEFVFQAMQDQGIGDASLGEYARWWKVRVDTEVTFSVESNVVSFHSHKTPDSLAAGGVTFKITTADGWELFAQPGEEVDLNSKAWKQTRPGVHPPEDIRRIREFDPRSLLGELHTKLMRKLR